jgi:hypothetical protein
VIILSLAAQFLVADTSQAQLTFDQIKYAYLMCVGGKIEGLARSTNDEFGPIFARSKEGCKDIERALIKNAGNLAAERAVREVDGQLTAAGPAAVQTIRERDAKFLRGLEK